MRKPKRLLACLMALCMVLSLLPATALAAFDDTDGHWGREAIDRWAGYGVLQGNGDGNFDPNGVMTRGQFASMLVQLMGYTATASNTFTDLPASAWYTTPILKLVAAGVMAGVGDNKADPESPITREQAARLLCVALNIKPSSAGTGFSDDGSMSGWAKGYVAALAERGWISGMGDGTFAPGNKIERAQAAQMLHGMVGEYVTTNGATVTGDVDGIVIIKANNVTIENAKLSDPVIVAPAASNSTVILAGTTKADEVVVEATGAKVVVAEGASAGTVEIAAARAGAEVAGTVGTVTVDDAATSANVTVDKTGKVESIDTAGYNTTVSVDGTVTDVNVEGKDTTVSVSGTVESVDVAASADGTDIKTTSGAKIKDVTTAADDVTVTGSAGTVGTVTATGSGSTDVQVKDAKVSNEGSGDVKAGNKTVEPGKSETVTSTSDSSSNPGGGGGGSSSSVELESVTISGDAIAGETLTANVTPSKATVTYQWMICETEDGDYAPIDGATSKTYTVKAEDTGKYIKVTVTASGSTTGGPASSSPVKVTAANDLANAVVTLEEGPYIYKGAQHTPEVTKVTLRGVDLDAEEDYEVSYGANINAGENAGTVTITAVVDSAYTGTKTVNFAIEKKPISVTINDAEVTYGSKPDTSKFSFDLTTGSELATGDSDVTAVVTMEYDEISVEGKKAGETVKITGTATSDNYDVTVVAGTLTVTKLDLKTATVAVTPSDIVVTYTGEDQTSDIISSKVNGVDVVADAPEDWIGLTKDDYELSFKGKTTQETTLLNADEYTIIVTAKDGGNCENSTEAKDSSITIEPAKITAVEVKIVKDENGALGPDDELQVHITTDGPVKNLTGVTYQWLNGENGDTPIADQTKGSITLTEATAADNNTIAVKVTINGNFEFAESVSASESCTVDSATNTCTVTVGKVGAKQLTIDMVDWDADTQELVDDDGVPVYPYNGEKKEPGVTVTAGSETVESSKYTVEYTDKNGAVMDCIDADTYCVKVTGKDGYYGSVGGSITVKKLTFTINPRQLDLDAENDGENATVEIEDIAPVEYDGKDHTPTVKITDKVVSDGKYELQEGKDYEVSCSPSPVKDAGKYTVTITGKGNYDGEIRADFVITKKAPTVTSLGSSSGPISVGYGEKVTIATVVTDAKASAIHAEVAKDSTGAVSVEIEQAENVANTYYVIVEGKTVGNLTVEITVDEGTNYAATKEATSISVTVTAVTVGAVAVTFDVDDEEEVVIEAGKDSVSLPTTATVTASVNDKTADAVELVSVKWEAPEGATVGEDGKVTAPGTYTATITVKAKTNYELTADKTSFTLNKEKATAKPGSDGEYTLTVTVTVTKEITSVAITLDGYQKEYAFSDEGVELATVADEFDAKPEDSVADVTLAWAGTTDEAYSNGKATAAGTYTGTISVEAAEGFTVTEKTKVTATDGKNGITLKTVTAKEGTLTWTFEVTVTKQVEKVAITIDLDNKGAGYAPDAKLPDAKFKAEGVEGLTTTWTGSGKFTAPGEYTADIVIALEDGYKLAENATYTVNNDDGEGVALKALTITGVKVNLVGAPTITSTADGWDDEDEYTLKLKVDETVTITVTTDGEVSVEPEPPADEPEEDAVITTTAVDTKGTANTFTIKGVAPGTDTVKVSAKAKDKDGLYVKLDEVTINVTVYGEVSEVEFTLDTDSLTTKTEELPEADTTEKSVVEVKTAWYAVTDDSDGEEEKTVDSFENAGTYKAVITFKLADYYVAENEDGTITVKVGTKTFNNVQPDEDGTYTVTIEVEVEEGQ